MTTSMHDRTSELVALARAGHIAAFVDRAWDLPPADLADVLVRLSPDERRELMSRLPASLSAPAIGEMSRHARRGRPAGDIMSPRMVTVNEADPIGLAIEAVRRQAAAIGDLSEIFVIDAARRLAGVLPVKQLLLASPSTTVREVMAPTPIRVGPDEDQQVVARVIARYALGSVPVVDRNGRLAGRITADDVRDVVIDEVAEDLLRFGGVSGFAADDSWALAVKSRLPSLYTNLLAAFGAAAVVYFFKGTVLRIVSLAVWMPVVAGVGGNAGTQALATGVRRLVRHPTLPGRLRTQILREVAIGAANGLAIGAVVAAVAVLLGESWKLGLVVGIALIGNLILAGIAGAAIPVLLQRLGRDPALASPVYVTALTDACGFALLLGLANRLLL